MYSQSAEQLERAGWRAVEHGPYWASGLGAIGGMLDV